jgi:LasA protease
MGSLHRRVKSPANALIALTSILVLAMVYSACGPLVTPTAEMTPIVVEGKPSPTSTSFTPPAGYVEYRAQSGDTLAVVASHFGVEPARVVSQAPIPTRGLIDPGQKLFLPVFTGKTTSAEILIPDSEVVFSRTAVDFDPVKYMDATNGKLKDYTDLRTYGTTHGIKIISQWAQEFSINPRLLLSLLELNGKWVTDWPETPDQSLYPYGYVKYDQGGLYRQAGWAVSQLMAGYYGWR